MSCPLEPPVRLRFWGGERTIVKRDAMLVRITTDNGMRGYGPGPATEEAQRAIVDKVRPRLVGREASKWAKLRRSAGVEIGRAHV